MFGDLKPAWCGNGVRLFFFFLRWEEEGGSADPQTSLLPSTLIKPARDITLLLHTNGWFIKRLEDLVCA